MFCTIIVKQLWCVIIVVILEEAICFRFTPRVVVTLPKDEKRDPNFSLNGYVDDDGQLTDEGKEVIDENFDELMDEHGEAIRNLAHK